MINYSELTKAIRAIETSKNPYQNKLFQVLKRELSALGYWRDKPRGAAFKKGDDERRVILKPVQTEQPQQPTMEEAAQKARLMLRRRSVDR